MIDAVIVPSLSSCPQLNVLSCISVAVVSLGISDYERNAGLFLYALTSPCVTNSTH